MIDPVRDFAAAATAFCAWCAGPVGEPQAELRAAQRHLALLYALALRLDPDVGADDVTPDADGSRCDEERWRTVYRRAGVLPVGYYAEVLDVQRLIDPPTGIGDVGDDIADVYRDLEEGLGLYREGQVAAAVWHWAFHFRHHWGRHALGALLALHEWRDPAVD